MNTEALQDQTATTTTGGRLRQAREQMGLSQQAVAERLCLKVTTVKEIEEDRANPNLASTFLRGYIRSYARLVHVSEEEILPMMAKQAPVRASKVAPMQTFALGKTRKKRDGWLMGFTWLILFVVIGLTGAWWWQNHQAQQKDITDMTGQSSSKLNQGGDGDNAASGGQTGDDNTGTDDAAQQPADQSPGSDAGAAGSTPSSTPAQPATAAAPTNGGVTANGGANANAGTAPVTAQNTASVAAPTSSSTLPTAAAAPAATEAADGTNGLVMNFTADCWLEVSDATGKKLFSGTQRTGGKLNLAGQAPFKLKIGAPAAVQIHYQGKPVDLSRYVRSSQVARLTIAAN